jgi:hypothetical protein
VSDHFCSECFLCWANASGNVPRPNVAIPALAKKKSEEKGVSVQNCTVWHYFFLGGGASSESAAANLRSLCGSLRNAPECSSQGSPIAAPHVGHGTAMSCFGVSSLDFITLVDVIMQTFEEIICSILLIQQIRGELTSRKVSHSSCCSAADLACL